ncbi:MAG: DNA-directed RNA polymerase subunit omega [Clostridium sp.]
MLRPSYNDLIKVVNSGGEPGDEPLVQSRYSIVIATAKRARQLVTGVEPILPAEGRKPLSIAIDELYQSKVKIISEEDISEDDITC